LFEENFMTQNVISHQLDSQQDFAQAILKSLPGLLLITAVALTAYFVAPKLEAFPLFKTYLSLKDFILAIIFGIAIRNTVGVADMFQPGLRYSTILTKTGIVVMGSSYSLAGLVSVGAQALVFIAVFLFATALTMMWLCRRLGMSPALGACLAAGMSVCGVSATIAIAPAVKARNEDMAYSIAVVLMFGLLALIAFPLVGRLFDLSADQFGAFAGVGIINSAQVLAAGFGYSPEAGVVAGIYNIGRVLFLPFVVLMLAIMAASQEHDHGKEAVKINKWQMICDKFPLFVLGFLAIVCMNTMGMLSKAEVKAAKAFMEWAFLLGFASIGLTTRLADLRAAGLRGFIFGFGVAGIKAVLALGAVLVFM
jgi:uncharacterized integral membrane protein (TIGR00698 family)